MPGVEDRLGRRDLFESLQRGAPSAHHITGDCWIDKLGRRCGHVAVDAQVIQTTVLPKFTDISSMNSLSICAISGL